MRYKLTITMIVVAGSHADALGKVHNLIDEADATHQVHAEEMDRGMIAEEIRSAAEAKGMDPTDIDQDWMDVLVDLLVDAST